MTAKQFDIDAPWNNGAWKFEQVCQHIREHLDRIGPKTDAAIDTYENGERYALESLRALIRGMESRADLPHFPETGSDSAASPIPRVWRAGDTEPEDKPQVVDKCGHRWEWRAEGDEPGPAYASQWHCLDTTGHMPWRMLLHAHGPLTDAAGDPR